MYISVLCFVAFRSINRAYQMRLRVWQELALERSKNDKLEQQAASPPKAAPMPQTEPAPELVPATSCTCVVC